MKILDRNENDVLLEPMRQYLENEGIPAGIQREWPNAPRHQKGPFVLYVEDEFQEDALRVLDNIDKYEIDDGVYLTMKSGETPEQVKRKCDRMVAWVSIILIVLAVVSTIYLAWRY